MDARVNSCPSLTERDIALLYRIEACLPITADVSRSDVMLCCLTDRNHVLSSQYGGRVPPADARILVARHAAPQSLSSIYVGDITGRAYTLAAQPTVHRALMEDRRGKVAEKKVPPGRTSSGAPVIQQVFPVRNAANRVIGAMLIETNMIEYERQRRRDRPFRQAVGWLQSMAVQGEIEVPEAAGRFGSLDGIFLVDEQSRISYMSGIAMNLFRSVGRGAETRGGPISDLEMEDERLVSQAVQANCCVQSRRESEGGRVWVRTAIPLRAPRGSLYEMSRRMREQLQAGRLRSLVERTPRIDGVLVLMHDATAAVQTERELNVKSAMIQEVHHRVKNNLQTIASILRIQSRRSESGEVRQHLMDAVNRVLSMSVIHEYLSQDEHRPINIRDVCQRIVGQAREVAVSPGRGVEIEMEGPKIRLPASQATASALVVNELLMNAIEHGLKDREDGKIRIALEDLGDKVRIEVADNGDGLPSDFGPDLKGDGGGSLGLQIVHTLVTDDLKGELLIEPQGNGERIDDSWRPPTAAKTTANGKVAVAARSGTRAVITFPKRSIKIESVVARVQQQWPPARIQGPSGPRAYVKEPQSTEDSQWSGHA